MEQFRVTGMSCAACSSRVEKAVSEVQGVDSCSVNLLTNSMRVEGDASEEMIIEAVEKAGYHAFPQNEEGQTVSFSERDDFSAIRKRLLGSCILLAALLYLSMGYGMFHWPLPEFLTVRPISVALIQLLLAAVILFIDQRFFISGFRALMRKAPNMDTLVALGSGAAFLYSICVVLIMMAEQETGHFDLVEQHLHGLYFDSAAMIVTLITVGKLLEAKARGKTTDALKGLIELAPPEACVQKDGERIRIPAEKMQVGDIFYVKPGEAFPADGVVLDGVSAVNEASLTGESIPRDVKAGDQVRSAAINCDGFLTCKATRVGKDTTLAGIIRLVSDAAATKAPIAKTADRAAGVFVPIVLGIALITILVWLLTGKNVGYALARGISVLVISCPCAMGLATPVAIMVGSGVGAKNGILFKTAEALEITGKTEIIALDKTGTITSGHPVVTDFISASGREEELYKTAFALEKCSEHPLSEAIISWITDHQAFTDPGTLSEFKVSPGNGLSGIMDGQEISGGSYSFMQGRSALPESCVQSRENFGKEGKTCVFFEKQGEYLGMAVIADLPKEDSAEAVIQLRKLGIRVVMLTGDSKYAAEFIGKAAGVDQVVAGVLPAEKEEQIRKLQKQNGEIFRIAMVGDGINDAPALERADIGIAIGAGTDIAIDAADVVLMKSRLTDVPAAVRLGRKVLRNIRQNLFWAFIYNLICIPLAAGVFIPLFGWALSPMIAAAAMSLSSFCVCMNALRLNRVRIYDSSTDTPIRHRAQAASKAALEENELKTTKKLTIEGMMCPHCEARVKKTLEGIDGVESALVSHKEGTAIVTLHESVSDTLMKEKIEAEDFKVTSIELYTE